MGILSDRNTNPWPDQGTLAERPAASERQTGFEYYVTDEEALYRVQGDDWVRISNEDETEYGSSGQALARGENKNLQFNLGVANTIYDIPGCSITFQRHPTRDIWVVWKIAFLGGQATANCVGILADENNVEKDRAGLRIVTNNYYGHVTGDEVIPAGVGSVTRKVRAYSSINTGFVNLANGGTTSVEAFVR